METNEKLIDELLETYDVVRQVGDYVIAVQINSEDEFDYTIYKDGKEFDGGIIENPDGIEEIAPEIFTEIMKMHDIKEEN